MTVTQEIVRSAIASAAGDFAGLAASVPLGELGINSLALLTVFIKLEEASKITLSQADVLHLSRLSIDQIADWFRQRAG